jgi:iron complex outermembrane receptor protein
MRELFGAALGKFVPNPGLSPVTAWIGELGVEHRTGTLSLGATGFVNRVFDTIDKRSFQSGPNAGKEQRVNLEGARVWGIETTARWAPNFPITVDGHLTWSRPRAFEEDETVRLDEKPELLGTWTVTTDLPAGVSLMGQVRYTDRVYARNDANEFVRLPSSVITDLRVGYDLSLPGRIEEGELFFRVDNLIDDAKFIGLGLPGPGRSIRAGVELAF